MDWFQLPPLSSFQTHVSFSPAPLRLERAWVLLHCPWGLMSKSNALLSCPAKALNKRRACCDPGGTDDLQIVGHIAPKRLKCLKSIEVYTRSNYLANDTCNMIQYIVRVVSNKQNNVREGSEFVGWFWVLEGEKKPQAG